MKRLYHHQIKSGLGKYQTTTPSNQLVQPGRLFTLMLGFVVAVLIISGRLFHLQVVNGQELREQSDNNRIYIRRVPAARGLIYDRHGEALVANQPVYRLLTDDTGRLQLDPKIITRELALQIEATQSGRVIQSIGRYYPFTESLAHLIGYVAEADQRDLASTQISIGEMTGKAGLEGTLNSTLIGQAGSELIEVDVRGRLLRQVGQAEPQPGNSVYLHIDAQLQTKAYELLEGYTGSVVVSQPKTGAILALVSRPSYDPNLFGYDPRVLGIETEQNRNRELSKLLGDTTQPMLFRAIAGTYPPGSVYKVVPSIAALEEGVVTEGTEIEDTGRIVIDNFQFRNWFFTQYGRTDGMVDLSLALQRSNDVYYYRIGEKLGVDNLAKWSRLFGLGQVTGLGLPGESAGLVPDRLWKERTKNERWYLGNTYHMSIGQGDLLTTPLQANQMMGVIANEGRLCKPLLIKSLGETEQKQAECQEVGILPEHIQSVKAGLVAACLPGGTGSPFFDYSLHKLNPRFSDDELVACKTGTAQYINPDNLTHAWFSIFAPVNNPEIMITVMLEGAGEGSQQAAPVAKELLDFWLTQSSNL